QPPQLAWPSAFYARHTLAAVDTGRASRAAAPTSPPTTRNPAGQDRLIRSAADGPTASIDQPQVDQPWATSRSKPPRPPRRCDGKCDGRCDGIGTCGDTHGRAGSP